MGRGVDRKVTLLTGVVAFPGHGKGRGKKEWGQGCRRGCEIKKNRRIGSGRKRGKEGREGERRWRGMKEGIGEK